MNTYLIKVEIKDGQKLWGKLVSETTDALLQEEAEKRSNL